MTELTGDIFSKFDSLDYFSKNDLRKIFNGSAKFVDERVHRALKRKRILKLRNGLYITNFRYLSESEKIKLAEVIAANLYAPSYLSLEYVLQKYGILQNNHSITMVTSRNSIIYKNSIGTFEYKNMKKTLHGGFHELEFHGKKYKIATKGKALFDYFYLKTRLSRNRKKLKNYLFNESKIIWENFSEQDFKQFDKWIWKSNSSKMMKIWDLINQHFKEKKFRKWKVEFLETAQKVGNKGVKSY